jgi:hypothetical protein
VKIGPDQAAAEAQAEARELATDGFWGVAYAGATLRLTVLVRNLTPRQNDYFVVDFHKNNRSTGRMVVNSDTGIVDAATGVEVDGEELPEFIAPADVRSRIKSEVTLNDGRKVRPPKEAPVVVVLWQHSRESQTMLQPFYWLRWPHSGLFLRADGEFFDRITPTDGMPHRVA